MKLTGTLLVVADVLLSRKFYEDLFGEKLLFDFGANQCFESGLSLQSRDSMVSLFGFAPNEIGRPLHTMELYYEADDFDGFLCLLRSYDGVEYVHGAAEPTVCPWGQRIIRVYDPDRHMIEVGEAMPVVVRRFAAQGLGIGEIAKRTELPPDTIRSYLDEDIPERPATGGRI